MKVTCNTVGEFIQNLDDDKAHIDECWIRIDEFNASDKNDIDWNVAVWLTCVVKRPEVPYILEFGKVVGMNIEQGSDQTDAGTVAAAAIVEEIESACAGLVIKTRQGKVEF